MPPPPSRAGAATALLLARAGLRVLVLDRAPAMGTDTLSTHALMRGGVLQLRRWGLLDAIAASTPPVRRTVVHYGDEAEEVEIKDRAGVSALYAPRRTVLDALLAGAAAAAGAEVRYGVAVDRLIVGSGGAVEGVVATERDGRELRLRAPLVVGADGHRSQVAAAAGAPFTWHGRAASAFVYGYFELPAEGYEWFYRPGASAGIIPTNEGLTCVWAGAPASGGFGAGGPQEAFWRWLAAAAPEAVDRVRWARGPGRLRGYPGFHGYLRRSQGPGWALVGDAAAYRDPLSAHGITDALRDAELLARAVVAGLGSGDLRAALRGYEVERDAVAWPLVEVTERLAAYDWTLPELRATLLELSKAMSREVQLVESFDGAPAAAA